jgi:class 3 adenylate cyclase
VHRVIEGGLAWVPLYVEPAAVASGSPVVRGFWPGTEASASSLLPGDRLLRVGNRSLEGVGRLGFLALAYEEAAAGRLSFVVERDGRELAAELELRAIPLPWRTLILIVGCGISACIVLLRAGDSRAGRSYALAALFYSLHWMLLLGGPAWQTWLGLCLLIGGGMLNFAFAVRAVLLLPEYLAPRTRLGLAWPWLFTLEGLGLASWVFGVPLPGLAGQRIVLASSVAAMLCMLVILARNLRRAEPAERRAIKWILYGFAVAFAPVVVAAAASAVEPGLWWLYELATVAPVLLPVCVLIAIVRSNLFDIDRVISATASYNVLIVVLLGAGLVVLPRAAEAASSLVGIDEATGQVALSLALAAVIVPAHRRLRPWIDRLFFTERFALEQGVEQLLPELSLARDPQALLQTLGARLDALLRPESCAIYWRGEHAFSPVFVRGPLVPPAFPNGSPLVETLARRATPIAADRLAGRPGQAGRSGAPALDPHDRAALATLGVPLLAPVQRGAELVAFVALGPKRSGDVYTGTDATLMAAVCEKIASELLRFDQEDVIRRGRAMQDSLRRYVPGAVADTLASGEDLELEAAERDVSVLFVDIRGYTTYSQSRKPEEIFSTVNEYTRTVSEIIRGRNGSVVEFNGDGMMAIFGAPRPLAHKEAAAVEAGREILVAVASVALAQVAGEPLSVGVGIATGETFVGNIQAADRLIWTAIGNATNLAARLQGLTRTLEAGMVIDAATWTLAGDAQPLFRRSEETAVRGRSDLQDVYVLPLAQAEPEAPDPSDGVAR